MVANNDAGFTHHQARFRADLESIIEGHSVLHGSPAMDWQDANPWPNEPVVVCDGNGVRVSHDVVADNIEFHTKAGESYMVHRFDSEPSELPMVQIQTDDSEKNLLGLGKVLDIGGSLNNT